MLHFVAGDRFVAVGRMADRRNWVMRRVRMHTVIADSWLGRDILVGRASRSRWVTNPTRELGGRAWQSIFDKKIHDKKIAGSF